MKEKFKNHGSRNVGKFVDLILVTSHIFTKNEVINRQTTVVVEIGGNNRNY